jgi:outer membrane protein OmpA-like peptidoglycan-associated protein
MIADWRLIVDLPIEQSEESVMRTSLAAIILISLVSAVPAGAQDDADGSKDHPMLSRFPGYYIEEYDPQDFGVYTFQLADDKEQKVEGRYWKIEYWLKDGARKGGPVEIGRNYANLLTERGGRKMYDTLDSGGGTLTARMPAAGKNIWVEIGVSNGGEVYSLTVVEEAAMVQQVEFTAMQLAKILNEQGSVALHGILFDTGQASLRSESKGDLQAVGELLKQQPALRLEIQGHTDNVGAADLNRRLSESRAAAVKQYLVATFAVAGDRLTTAGFGDTKPVADNRTEPGRAQNRRVELVKK